MNAQTLFDVDATVRHSDPATSRAAAAGDRTTIELDVLSAVRAMGWTGATLDDCYDALKGKVRHGSVSRRLTSLERSGLVEVVGKRRGSAGRDQQVYRAKGHLQGLDR